MEAIAAAKVKEVDIYFDYRSTHIHRAVDTISDGLAQNKFIRKIILQQVPEEMIEPARQTMRTNSGMTQVYVIQW